VRRAWTSLALASVLLAGLPGCDRNSNPGNIGKVAPQFVMTDGVETLDLGKLRGKVVVLNLWATWCAPCVQELPSLLALKQKMPDIAVVAVSTDQDEDVYRQFLVKHHVDVPTVRDSDQKVNALYGTVQIPETYIIDRQGVLRRKFIGAQDWTGPEITDYLKKLSL
jgi:cytochrome c biogenesis protein CcmG/thiol:disulfide interchange protein DsbE